MPGGALSVTPPTSHNALVAAVWMAARSQLRRRWGATVALTLLVGLAGGAGIAAVSGASRRAGAGVPPRRGAPGGGRAPYFFRPPDRAGTGLAPTTPSAAAAAPASPPLARPRPPPGRFARLDRADEAIIDDTTARLRH